MKVSRMIAKFMYHDLEYTIPLIDVNTAIRAIDFLDQSGWANVELIDLYDDSHTSFITLTNSVSEDKYNRDELIRQIKANKHLFVDIDQVPDRVNYLGRFDWPYD